MDVFETVRRAARALRDELAASGADLATGSSLVAAAAERLQVDVFPLAADDPLLKGSLATFDEQIRMICFADNGTPGQRAALIAHELGHVCLHTTTTSCSSHDVDSSQPSELAPVGLQRVEDYSGHERRELQANVFARELLLPRDVARRLYLDDGLPATTIAERLVLPRDLVRQQLLDSLLLPEVPEMMEAASPPRKRDDSQERAARHRGSAFLLQAGPGTGKTRTLVQRVLGLLADGVDPASIVILTFSNRAAGEVHERVARAAPEAAAKTWMGTFHAFGLDLVRRYHNKLELPTDPVLFDRSDGIAILEDILPTLGLTHYRDLWNPARELREMLIAISRAKDEVVDAAGYRALAQQMIDGAATEDDREVGERALEVARVYKLYQQQLREHGAVDFGDLVMLPALLLEQDPAVQITVSRRHRHVLVDEYQDVNRASARLLRALAGDGKLLWAVGDSRQSIYRFRGASSVNMSRFADDYAGGNTDQLSVNYRSCPEIVRTLVAVAPKMSASRGMLPLAFEADRAATGVKPEIRRFETLDDEIAGIAESIRELESNGVKLQDQAVLCRSNGRLNQIASALEARGIAVLHLGSIFEREEVRDLLALLTLVAGRLGDGLVRIGAMARYDLALQDVHTAIGWLREQPSAVVHRLSDLAVQANMTPQGRDAITRLAADLDGFHPGSSPWDVLATYLLDRTRTLADIARSTSITDRTKAIACWQLLNFLRQEAPGKGPRIRRVLERIRMLVLLAEERDLRRVPSGALHLDAVRLMTVHAAKGLEFEAVHVPGMTVASFPTSRRGQICPPPAGLIDGLDATVDAASKRAHEEEEECLFFVASSRARSHLRFYLAAKQRNGNRRNASGFLDWLHGHALDSGSARGGFGGVADAEDRDVEVAWPDDWRVTHRELKSFDSCPRRYFYTHVLGLGTAMSPTAYGRTQRCLYELIGWLARARAQGAVDENEALRELDKIWSNLGPVDHAFAGEYRRIAEMMVRRLVRFGDGLAFRGPLAITLDLDSGRLVVEPDEVAEEADGTVVLRRIRPGYERSKESDKLEYRLLHVAGTHAYRRHRVEVVHLTDDVRAQVDITPKKTASTRAEANTALAAIADGRFPPEVDAYSCPQCPHFFICPSIPRGGLSLR